MSKEKGTKNVTPDEKCKILELDSLGWGCGAIAYATERNEQTVKKVIKMAKSKDGPKKK